MSHSLADFAGLLGVLEEMADFVAECRLKGVLIVDGHFWRTVNDSTSLLGRKCLAEPVVIQSLT